MKLTDKNIFSHIEKFHSDNIYLPTRTIYFGGIGDEEQDVVNCRTVAQVIRNLHILEHKEIKPISLILNTPGGNWDDGLALYDMIRILKSPVNILGIGKIWSMGSVILQAGQTRTLSENSSVMIHEGSDGYAGSPRDFEAWAEVSKHSREVLYKIFYEKMKEKDKNITIKKIENMCRNDTIFTAIDAVKKGLADSIIVKE